MTISERVYRAILSAYPTGYRREYGELMVQLLRDQLRECGPGRGRIVQLWGRILADVLRTIPAIHLESLTSSGGGMTRKRTRVAVVCSILFAGFGFPLVTSALWAVPGASSFMHAHGRTWPASFIYAIAWWTVVEWLTVVLAVALFLAIMQKLGIRRLSLGAMVAVPIVAAGLTGLRFLSVLQLPLLVERGAMILPLLMGVASAVWAANVGGAKVERCGAGPDRFANSRMKLPKGTRQ